ncbi:MAG: hypothetical protein WBV39_10360 [Rudaea sp.]
MQIPGRCHCGNISFVYSLEPDPAEIPARACSCSFCAKHGGVWTASPTASLVARIDNAQQVNRYAFGTRTAQFHVCRICGIAPFVTSMIQGREYALVSVNAFENVPASMLCHTTASFDGEEETQRLERRAKNWVPDVQFVNRNE